MTTEITKYKNTQDSRGRVFYDADCGFCRRTLIRWAPVFERRGFCFEPLQNAVTAGKYPIPPEEFLREMKLLRPDGRWCGGADAWIELWRTVWWLKPVAWLFVLPGFDRLLAQVYQRIAANRFCLNGACLLAAKRAADRWVPLLVLPVAAITFRHHFAPWVFMWLLALAIYIGCKWLTLRDAGRNNNATFRDRLIYLFFWPGMAFKEFVAQGDTPRGSTNQMAKGTEWLAAFAKTLMGAGLIWGVVPALPPDAWSLRGWFGMIGLIMMLHFGTFHLLALTLRAVGFNARPNMNAPLFARSLADFWGRRWNTSFNVLADRYGFRPLTPWIGTRAALVVVFIASGLIHELVVTFPAGAGYGLPTLYFLLQAGGLLLEHTPLIRRRPLLNRAITWAFLIAPLGCLFPPVFVRNIILPMLHAIGAT